MKIDKSDGGKLCLKIVKTYKWFHAKHHFFKSSNGSHFKILAKFSNISALTHLLPVSISDIVFL